MRSTRHSDGRPVDGSPGSMPTSSICPGASRISFGRPSARGSASHTGTASSSIEDARLVRLQGAAPVRRARAQGIRHLHCAAAAPVFRRAVLERRPWDTEIRRVMDWDLYMRLVEQGVAFRHVPYPVGAFRLHPAQVTSSSVRGLEVRGRRGSARHGRPVDIAERWYMISQGPANASSLQAPGSVLRSWRYAPGVSRAEICAGSGRPMGGELQGAARALLPGPATAGSQR